jgi:hypothetical protein
MKLLEYLDVDENIILKLSLKNNVRLCGLDASGSG